MNNEYSNLRKELEAGRSVIIFTTGVSMEPLLHDKRKENATHVLVIPTSERLSVSISAQTDAALPIVIPSRKSS